MAHPSAGVDLLASWAVACGALLEAGARISSARRREGIAVRVRSKDATYVYLQLTLNL